MIRTAAQRHIQFTTMYISRPHDFMIEFSVPAFLLQYAAEAAMAAQRD
jgi:hypothetical protein